MAAFSELYAQPEIGQLFMNRWTSQSPLNEMLLMADAVVDQQDPVAFLDDLAETDSKRHYEIKKIITGLPAEVIHANYGTEMLAWAAANATFTDTTKELYKGLEKHAGIDPMLFEKARLWEWKRHCSSKGKNVLGQYSVMEYLTQGGLYKVDLEGILTNAALPGVELSQKRLKDYALMPLVSEESFSKADGPAKDWHYLQGSSDIYWGIWLDAPTGFALTYKGKPNAVVALAKSGPSELMIYQLQGVQAKRIDLKRRYAKDNVVGHIGARGLAPLDWQKVMVEVAQELAAGQNIPVIGLQAAKNNKWTRVLHEGGEPHISMETAERAYDVTGQRLGFERGARGNWYKQLS